MGGKSHWERVYATTSPDQLSWYQERPELSLRLIQAAGVRPESRIIDVGGGASTLVDVLLDEGFANVAVLDLAEGPIEQAKARLGSRAEAVEWLVADVTEFDPPHSFDLWHDRAVFHFLTEARDRSRYRRALLESLRPSGQAIVATFAMTGPERCSGLDVVRYSPESLNGELGADFELLEACAQRHTTPGGATQDFIYCRFRRAGAIDA